MIEAKKVKRQKEREDYQKEREKRQRSRFVLLQDM